MNCYSQQTYIPDDNFEIFLEGNGMRNGIPNDDFVTTSNISVVYSLNATICLPLTCIEVDDMSLFTSAWIFIDPQTSLSTACASVGVAELNTSPKQFVQIVDLMGRATSFTSNKPLIYMYSDGTVEKVFVLE
ncbi:MAG: hypothetical protein HRT57_00845 [Crocinitomicaceae bacterium]|nr:hypothetical protein [Crocinitomicaceae bacterium]